MKRLIAGLLVLCLAVAPQPGFSASKNNPLLGGRSPGTGGGGGGTSPGGSNGQIQFNNAGAFDGLSNVPVSQGGTGANTAAGARSGLGLAPIESLVVNDSARDTKYQPVDSGFGPATAMSRTFGEKFTDEYHVRDWASASASPIKCDTVEVYDVSSTNGTATFTSAGAYTYNAAHVGRTAYVVSYDNNHTPKLTASGTILSGSGNTVTLSGNANRTSTSQYMVIYGNDDTAGLNDLIAAAGKKGGTLVLPNGTCSVSASLTISSRIMLGGQSIRQSAIIARPNMNGAIIKSKNYDALAGQTGTNYGDNPLTQAFYGLRNLRIDGASFAQASPNKCVQMHGNAKYIDSVEILNCSDPLETEAAFTYAYSATDPMSREEDYINNLFIRNFTGKGWLNRGGHDTQGGHILIYNSLASTDWGYRQECSGGTYGGNGFFESLHVYPGPNAIYIGCGATRFGTLYSDLGRTEVVGGNVKVGMLKILGCGYGQPTACLTVSGKGFEANVEFGWYWQGDRSNVIGVDIADSANGWRINMSDAGVVNPDPGAIVFRNRADYGQLTGSIKGVSGTGAVCVDLGGAMGQHRFNTEVCKTHLAYQATPESYRNIINWSSFAQAGETVMTGTPQPSDIFCNTESGAVNGAFRGCVSGRHTLRADNGNFLTLYPSTSTTNWSFFYPDAPGAAGTPLLSNGTGVPHVYGARTGNTTTYATASGAFTPGNFVKTDASGNLIDGGAGGGGGGSPGGTSGQIQYNNAGSFAGVTAVPFANGGTGQTTKFGAQAALGQLDYVLATNNASIPNNFFTNTSTVMHSATTHLTGPANYSCFRLKYVNWYLGTTSENQGGYNFNLRASVYDGTRWHRMTFNGKPEVLLSKTWGNNEIWTDANCDVKTAANQKIMVHTRRVAAEVLGSYNHLTNTSGQGFRQDGLIQGSTDASIDLTMGQGIAYGAYSLPATVNGSGVVTSANLDPARKGVNYVASAPFIGDTTSGNNVINNILSTTYINLGATISGTGIPGGTTVTGKTSTSITLNNNATATNAQIGLTSALGGANLVSYCGGAGCNQPGSLIPGSGAGAGGYCNLTNTNGGQVSTITLGSGGTGYSSGNPPLLICSGAGNPSSGYGTPTSNYGPAAVVAIADRPVCSLALEGDSITAGFTSVDGTGDINGSHGLYEQYLAGKCGLAKVAVSGESALGRITIATRRDAFWQDVVDNGVRLTHAIVAYGTNDFLTNTAVNVVSVTQGYMTTLRDKFKVTLGVPKVYAPAVWPAVTSGSSKVDKTLMTPFNVNYNAAGRVSQYNTALIGGTPLFDGIIRTDYAFDTTDTHLPRVDAYAPANKTCNTNSSTTVDGLANTTGLFVGMGVQATGIPAGATITAVNAGANSITLSAAATATATVTCSFFTPYMAGDGVHPSVGVGIPHTILNMTYPSLAVP